jgi:regulatory protein
LIPAAVQRYLRHTAATDGYDPAMKITAIEPQTRNLERVDLSIDGAFRLALPAELVYSVPLRVGDVVTEEQLREWEVRDQSWRAREAALSLLSFRPRTAVELQRRLREKGFDPEIASGCIAELTGRGLIDDASFAQSFIRDRIRFRPRGAQRILQELRTKGVDWETARASVNEVWEEEEVSEMDLARQAAAKWSPRAGESQLRARRRLYNFLARRGFSADAVRQVVDEILP